MQACFILVLCPSDCPSLDSPSPASEDLAQLPGFDVLCCFPTSQGLNGLLTILQPLITLPADPCSKLSPAWDSPHTHRQCKVPVFFWQSSQIHSSRALKALAQRAIPIFLQRAPDPHPRDSCVSYLQEPDSGHFLDIHWPLEVWLALKDSQASPSCLELGWPCKGGASEAQPVPGLLTHPSPGSTV